MYTSILLIVKAKQFRSSLLLSSFSWHSAIVKCQFLKKVSHCLRTATERKER